MYQQTPAAQSDQVARETAIVSQVEWYMGKDNLASDFYLKRQMDDDLWVSLDVIMSFPKMQRMDVTDKGLVAKLLRARSTIVEVDETNSRIRPAWAQHSTLILKDVPPTANVLSIQALFDTSLDPTMPPCISIHPQDGKVWHVVFHRLDGARIAMEKTKGKTLGGAPVNAEVKAESATFRIGDAVENLAGAPIPTLLAPVSAPGTPNVFQPSGTASPYFPASQVEAAPGGGSRSSHSQKQPSSVSSDGHTPHPGMSMVGNYGNVPPAMMNPMNFGSAGMGPQGLPAANHQYSYMPAPYLPSFNGGSAVVPTHVIQGRGHGGSNAPYYVAYASKLPFDQVAHAQAVHAQQQQHQAMQGNDTKGGGVSSSGMSNTAASQGQAQVPVTGATGTSQSNTEVSRESITHLNVNGGHPSAGGHNANTTHGQARQQNSRRSIARHPNQHAHHPHTVQPMLMNGHEGVPMQPGLTLAAMGQHVHAMHPALPVGKNIPMQYYSMTPLSGRQNQVVMAHGRVMGGYPPGSMVERGMRGYSGGPGGKQHRHQPVNPDGTPRMGAKGPNSVQGDNMSRAPGSGKKHKKTNRNGPRSQGGPSVERHSQSTYEHRHSDGKGETTGGSSLLGDEQKTTPEQEKKQEPNLSTMYFPPLPGSTASSTGIVSSAKKLSTVVKSGQNSSPQHEDASSNVTSSPTPADCPVPSGTIDSFAEVEEKASELDKGPQNVVEEPKEVNDDSSDPSGIPGSAVDLQKHVSLQGIISDDRLSTASSSGGSDHVPNGRLTSAVAQKSKSDSRDFSHVPSSGMTYAQILCRKASAPLSPPVAASIAAQSAPSSVNASKPHSTAKSSSPSSPSDTDFANVGTTGSKQSASSSTGDLPRPVRQVNTFASANDSVGAIIEVAITEAATHAVSNSSSRSSSISSRSGGEGRTDDTEVKSPSKVFRTPSAGYTPADSNRPSSVWARKPRSVLEAAPSTPIRHANLASSLQTGSTGSRQVAPPAASSSEAQVPEPALNFPTADKLVAGSANEDPSSVQQVGRTSEGDTRAETDAGSISEHSSVTHSSAEACQSVNKTTASEIQIRKENPATNRGPNPRGAWASGKPRKWATARDVGSLTKSES